jgi:class 3 adenylate cyclase/tetratricopeptide (TPR) repeat protein
MLACPQCGRESADDASFCAGCGAHLGVAATSAREERKVVSVVFADLVGSTALAEQSDPEDVRAMLAAHHARVRAELERYGGTVEKFIGDAVVAVFGAPVVHEDDPERAVRAALAIRDGAREADVELRVAVNTGEALVSLDARPTEGEGMVAGDVVNTAARIQSAAPVNGVLVGETTFRATAHMIEYRKGEPIAAKGKARPVAVWEAIAPRARFGSDVEQAPLGALVGREREVDQLRDALTRVRQEHEPQLVTLVGVPGIGKSRLVVELLQIVDEAPELITWRQGRCLPYGEGISYWALGEMAKAQAGILEGDTADEATRKLSEAVAALVADAAEAAWVTGHLKPLAGLGTDAPVGSESRGEAFAAWRRFFEALGEQRPTVLVFEDLHWADDGLLDFVDGLVDRATGVPLLVLCSARPELLVRSPGWGGGKANALTLSLSALSDEDTARLIAAQLAQAVLPAEMQQTLLRRADGNPLFAEEYIRMLRDRGLLRRDGETWRLDAADVEVPETVQGIIAARLDALEAQEKELLQAASVVGKVFWLGAVTAIAGIPPWEAEERLHALERKELVRRDRRASVAGEQEYAVRHVLVRDVAYGQIPRSRRADLHARAAEWIESLGADRAEDRAEMLAHHYVAALELTRAAGGDTSRLESSTRRALREAGDRAYALSALESAVSFYTRALELWPRDEPDYPRLLVQLGSALVEARNEGETELREAAELLLAAGDPEGAASAESLLGELTWLKGRQQEAFAHYDRSLELIDGRPETRVTAWIRSWAWRSSLLANHGPPLEEGKRILGLLEELGTPEDVLHARINLGLGYAYEGDPHESLRLLESAREDALRANSYVAARAYVNVASTCGTMGNLQRCAQMHREGLEVAHRFGTHHDRWFEAELLMDDFYAGDWSEAARNADAYLAHGGPVQYMDGAAYYVLAAMAAARGAREAAAAHSAELLTRAREIGDPQVFWATLGACALVELESGNADFARRLLDELRREVSAAESFQVDVSWVDGVLAAATLGLGAEFRDALRKATFDSPWVEATRLITEGRLEGAGDVLHAHAAYAYAALVRLHAAERTGQDSPGLRDAVAFYRRVDATAYLARAERLLQATA